VAEGKTTRLRGTSRIPGADAVRVVTALGVGMTHAYLFSGPAALDHGRLRDLLDGQFVMVDIFFIMSGLVVFSPQLRGGLGPKTHFWLRRLARMGPLYLLFLIGSQLPQVLPTGAPPAGSPESLRALAVNASFLQEPVFGWKFSHNGMGYDPVVWTISIEVAFYLVLPFVAKAFAAHPVRCFLVAVAGARLWSVATAHLTAWVPSWIWHPASQAQAVQAERHWLIQAPSYAGQFALGMLLAVVLVRHREHRMVRGLEPYWGRLVLSGLIGIYGYVLIAGRHDAMRGIMLDGHLESAVVLYPSVAALFVGLALADGRWARVLNAQAVVVAAEAMYALYLVHVPLMGYALGWHWVTPDASYTAFGALTGVVAVAFVAGVVANRWLEEPVRKAVARRLKARLAAAGQPKPARVRRPAPESYPVLQPQLHAQAAEAGMVTEAA
jgi:peptidoglycan/LPS O-acetylase OafA/YrhL